MNAEVLLVADCPHASAAAEALRTALDACGAGAVEVTTTLIDSQDQADRRGFLGSPTFCIDGADLFPDPGGTPALACRLYPGLQGLPPADELRRALERSLSGLT